jgi:hypothetical protein
MITPAGPPTMRFLNPGSALRVSREKRTIRAMVLIYCRGRHGLTSLCSDCQELLDYAHCRLDRCPFGDNKPTCVNCPIHCYKPTMRANVKEVMRYAGPRLIFRYPILAFMHLLDGRRSPLHEQT